ncbi:MAG: AMP-binding protein, partial [Armatimonadetes bacterium]|nr:AMP-binding protein [Armatimonadota bacterium]
MTRSTIPEVFQQSVEQHGDRTALLHVVGRDYAPVTYNELARRAEQFAFGLLSLGIQPGDRIGVISENRPEWAAADLGMLSIGAVNTPVFTTLPPAQLRYLFRDSGTRLVLVSDAKQLAKMLAIRDDLPDLERLIVLDAQVELPDDGVLRFDAVTPPADAVEELTAERQRRLAALQPDDLASIIYTSGTTGEPKGAMLTHWNFVSNAQAARAVIDVGPADRYLSFLPLNHVFERLVGHYLMLFSGVTVAYAESLFTLPNNMRQVRPTIMAGVPRFYE